MEKNMDDEPDHGTRSQFTYLWLARNEGMDLNSNCYVTYHSDFLFHSFIRS